MVVEKRSEGLVGVVGVQLALNLNKDLNLVDS